MARAAHQSVDGRRLAGQPDLFADLGGFGDDVVAGDLARPSVGEASVVRMRIAVVLPAPLWPSRPSTEPVGDREVEVAERPLLAVALAEPLGHDGGARVAVADRADRVQVVHRTNAMLCSGQPLVPPEHAETSALA